MKLTIRPIEANDNKELADVIRKVFREFKIDKSGTVYTDPTTDALYELFRQGGSCYWVALCDENIVGGCGIFPTKGLPNGCAELVKLYLAKEVRGKGLGEILMKKSIQWAVNYGYTQLYLESFPELSQAISLYTKLGFKTLKKPLGDSGHYACNLWMCKKIDCAKTP
ncbi:MAG: GNAT family N-acetyltransferase [Flavobacteriales bacterium]